MKYLHVVFFFLGIYLLKIVYSHSTSSEYSAKGVHGFCTSKVNGKCEEKVKDEENENNINTVISDNNFQWMKDKNRINVNVDKVPWYLSVPLLSIVFATSPTIPEGKCKRQVKKYLEELNNGTLWAVRMFDASTKYPEGIMTGHTRHYGNFDECYQLQTTIDNNSSDRDVEVVDGKYCLVKIEYHKLNSSYEHVGPYTLEFNLNESVWEAIKEKGDFRRIKRYLLELALCVPDACSASEIVKALREPLKKIGIEQGLNVKTEIKGECQTQKNSPKFSTGAIIYCCVIFGLFLLVGVSTWYDKNLNKIEKERKKSLVFDIFLCFSAQSNFKSITNISYDQPGLDCLHLFRLMLMCYLLCIHRLFQYFTNPMINSEYLEYTFTTPSYVVMHSSTMFIEIFYTFGGILVSYYMLMELDKKKTKNILEAIFIRYFRFTPPYLVVIFFVALIMPHLGPGPYWEYKMGLEISSCADNWWANILYINNYINTNKLCIFQTWYISVDFHLYVVALFVIYLFWKMPRTIGYAFLIIIIIGGCIIPFYITYVNNDEPIMKGVPKMHDVRESRYFTDRYIKTHERIATYFLGVLGGVIIYDYKLSQWTIPPYWIRLSLLVGSFALGIQTICMGFIFCNPNIILSPIESALYSGLYRPGFALITVSIIVILSLSNRSEFYYKILTPRWAQPAAKLTYGVYLTHNTLQNYDIGTVRHGRVLSRYQVTRDLVSDIILSFLLSFILSLLIEEPFRKIGKQLTKKPSNKQKSVNNENLSSEK